MNKLLLVAALLLCSINAFHIYDTVIAINQNNLKDIDWPFTNCGKGTWDIEKLTLGGTPARNTNDDITVTGTANDDINFLQVDLTVKLNGVFLHNETIPFKQNYESGDNIKFKYTNFVPGFAPSGAYGLTFNFKTKSGDNGCMGFSFKL